MNKDLQNSEIRDEQNHLANVCPGSNQCGLCRVSFTKGNVLCKYRHYDQLEEVYACHKPEKVYVFMSERARQVKQEELETAFSQLPQESYFM